MSGATYDAIVVGGGHNGLVAALTLAPRCHRVLVLERASAVGGLCASYEFAPGFSVPGLFPETGAFRSHLTRELGLEEHGLFRREEPAVLAELEEGATLLHPGDRELATSGVGAADADAYARWRAFLETLTPFVQSLLDAPPPRLEVPEIGLAGLPALQELAGPGWALRRLGRRSMVEAMRVLPMCAADWMREYFPSEALAATLAAPALLGSYNGPWAAGSAAALIFRECVAGPPVAGGATALITALESACLTRNVDIRTDSAVERILVEGGRVRGVRLAESGEEIGSTTIVAASNPKTVLLDLVGPRFLDATTEQDLHNYRCRGTLAVLLLAVEGSVETAIAPGARVERLRLGTGGFDELEKAFDAVKYGEISGSPYLEVWIPSIETPSVAPSGCHVVAALISCAPGDLAGGWTVARREALTQAAVRRINRHIPGLRDRLTGGKLLAPPDLERLFALPGGHLLHGEPALDQLLFLRPSLGLSRYRTPIEGLYLGGGGSHPGGGVSGMPGWLAAKTVLG